MASRAASSEATTAGDRNHCGRQPERSSAVRRDRPGEESRVRSIRWLIAILIAVATAVGYLDRQTLALTWQSIQGSIPLSDNDFGTLQSLFCLAYALMYVGGGWLMDFLGTRRGLLLIVVWWSLACAGHGLAHGFAHAGGRPGDAGPGARRTLPGRSQGGRRVVSGPGTGHGDGDGQRRQLGRARSLPRRLSLWCCGTPLGHGSIT